MNTGEYTDDAPLTAVDPDFEELLAWLKESRGFDFTGYKRPSLLRRITRRMHDVGIDSFAVYRDHLELHQEEFVALFNTILINVTSFCRDPDTWAYLADHVLPELVGVSPERLERFFEREGTRAAFRKDLRRGVIFGRNDLVQDAPISHVDLLLCRNTLMYFNADTQHQVAERLHFALEPHGVLMLGKAELLLSHSTLFAPVELSRRLFRRRRDLGGNGRRGRVFLTARTTRFLARTSGCGSRLCSPRRRPRSSSTRRAYWRCPTSRPTGCSG